MRNTLTCPNIWEQIPVHPLLLHIQSYTNMHKIYMYIIYIACATSFSVSPVRKKLIIKRYMNDLTQTNSHLFLVDLFPGPSEQHQRSLVPLAPSQVVCRLKDDCLSGQTSYSGTLQPLTQLTFSGTMSCRCKCVGKACGVINLT